MIITLAARINGKTSKCLDLVGLARDGKLDDIGDQEYEQLLIELDSMIQKTTQTEDSTQTDDAASFKLAR